MMRYIPHVLITLLFVCTAACQSAPAQPDEDPTDGDRTSVATDDDVEYIDLADTIVAALTLFLDAELAICECTNQSMGFGSPCNDAEEMREEIVCFGEVLRDMSHFDIDAVQASACMQNAIAASDFCFEDIDSCHSDEDGYAAQKCLGDFDNSIQNCFDTFISSSWESRLDDGLYERCDF